MDLLGVMLKFPVDLRLSRYPMTVRARFRFVVKANAGGTPWIAFEPLDEQIRGEGLPIGIFGFDLPTGTSDPRAEEIANYLDDNVSSLSFTQMPLS